LTSAAKKAATSIEIRNGRLIDPRHRIDGKMALFVAA
jgi:hypothetical protein